MIAATISLSGIVYFLLCFAVLVFVLWGVEVLLAQIGVAVPRPALVIVGFIILCLVLLWFLGAIGSGGPVIVR